jgi:hypothetical protein
VNECVSEPWRSKAVDFARDLVNPKKLQALKCDQCDGWLILEEMGFTRIVEGIEVAVEDLPVLYCHDCELVHLPGRSKAAVLRHVEEAKRTGMARVVITRKPEAKKRRFGYCQAVQFLYDPTDHDYLPGLQGRGGFLTPVFFNKAVLLKYLNHPDYVVELGSDTYGTIARRREHLIPFGVNRSGKVIAWLGDLDTLPPEELHYLRSENVPSDHDIGSDFYLGQIEAVFTDYSRERQIFRLRSEVAAKCLQDHGLKLNAYDLEVFKLMAEVVRPVAWGEKEVRGVIEALNKVLVESLNADGLRQGILTLKPDEPVKGLGGMKLLQRWTGLAYPDLDAGALLSPFFVLYDFRIVVAHLIPANEKLTFCYERMGLPEGSRSPETLYDALIAGITRSYEELLRATPAAPKAGS